MKLISLVATSCFIFMLGCKQRNFNSDANVQAVAPGLPCQGTKMFVVSSSDSAPANFRNFFNNTKNDIGDLLNGTRLSCIKPYDKDPQFYVVGKTTIGFISKNSLFRLDDGKTPPRCMDGLQMRIKDPSGTQANFRRVEAPHSIIGTLPDDRIVQCAGAEFAFTIEGLGEFLKVFEVGLVATSELEHAQH